MDIIDLNKLNPEEVADMRAEVARAVVQLEEYQNEQEQETGVSKVDKVE